MMRQQEDVFYRKKQKLLSVKETNFLKSGDILLFLFLFRNESPSPSVER